MMWTDKVLADGGLSSGAKKLAAVIAERFSVPSARYCAFFDKAAAAALDTGIDAVKGWRLELEHSGYLQRLQFNTREPTFSLRLGYPVASDEGLSA